ncbi:MAG: hypothetical protein KDJ65_27460 [Anaerolineae bacterium]|nr:hypothetical protein [Anaerolineae bacterium]
MTGIENLKATRKALRDMSRVVTYTRKTLAKMIRAEENFGVDADKSRSTHLFDALEHLGEVREGFILSQRTEPNAAMSELREIVRHILMDWQWVHNMNLILAPGDELDTLNQQLVFYNHAMVAMAVLPRLPANAITFPQRRPTYKDVSVPVLPGELLARIEELEEIIYQAEVKSVRDLDYGSFRRTYAFFDASSWLVKNHLKPMLGDL